VEESDRWCQLSSAPSETSPSLIVQAARSVVPKAAYCWPPQPPASHWPTVQRSTEELLPTARGRALGLRRSVSMVGPAFAHPRHLMHRSASISAPLSPCSGTHTPGAHAATGSATWWVEGSTTPLRPSSSTPALRSASIPMARARSSSPVASVALPISQATCLNAQSAAVSRSQSPRPKATSLALTPGLALPRSPSPCQKEPRILVKIRDSPPRRVLPEGSTLHRSHWRLLNK